MEHRLINRIVTGEIAVRLTGLLSEGLNRLCGLFPGAKRRRAANRAAFSAYSDGDFFINGQGRGPVARLPFGNYTMDYNGCEVIASCNALRALGAPRPLSEAAAYYERRGLFLFGLWGTHVCAIPGFFQSLGHSTQTLYASAAWGPHAYDAAFARAPAAVFSFWNSARSLRRGVHTVALAHDPGGGLVIFNLYPRDREPNREYRSIAEFARKTRVLPILLVTVSP